MKTFTEFVNENYGAYDMQNRTRYKVPAVDGNALHKQATNGLRSVYEFLEFIAKQNNNDSPIHAFDEFLEKLKRNKIYI